MDSEEPPNVRVACSGDIDEVVRLMHDAAAWMSAKGTPAWDVARIDRTFAETFVLRSELLVASCSDGIVGCCTLSAEDPEFWPDALKGEAAYLHKLAVRRTGTVAKLAMRQPFVLFKGLTFQKLCLPGAFRPGDHHNKMLRPGLCVVHASPQYL